MPDLETSPLCLGSWNDGADERLAVGDDVGVVTVYATWSGAPRGKTRLKYRTGANSPHEKKIRSA
eukprot:scaffold9345_cov84-Isochrysis_galbana.AAC.1